MAAPKDFQSLLLALQTYWAERGCALLQGYDLEVGAGTFEDAGYGASSGGMRDDGREDQAVVHEELQEAAAPQPAAEAAPAEVPAMAEAVPA